MHALRAEDVHGAGKRCRHRRHEDRIRPVIELLDDECGDEGFFDFNKRRLPRYFLARSCSLLREFS
jgi:hypothetical protein